MYAFLTQASARSLCFVFLFMSFHTIEIQNPRHGTQAPDRLTGGICECQYTVWTYFTFFFKCPNLKVRINQSCSMLPELGKNAFLCLKREIISQVQVLEFYQCWIIISFRYIACSVGFTTTQEQSICILYTHPI